MRMKHINLGTDPETNQTGGWLFFFNKYYIKFNCNLYKLGLNYIDIKLFYIDL
jgi:hypothetical protein